MGRISSSVRHGTARTLQRWGDRLSGQQWRTDTIAWTRHLPCRFRSADELRGLCLQLQEVMGAGTGVTVSCPGGVIAVGPEFERVAEGLDLYSRTSRRALTIREDSGDWEISFGNRWRVGDMPVSLGVRGLGTDHEVRERCWQAARVIDASTARYGWRRRLIGAPIVEAYTGRDVRTHAHDLKVATYGIAGGIGANFLIDWIKTR